LAWKLTGAPKRQPRIPAKQRIYAIGDVHGRADLLADVFGQIDRDLKARPIENSVQVFLGDYIDRGPHSRQVIDLLVKRQSFHHVLFLKGNHEVYVSQFLSEPTILSQWQRVGGIDTLLSYGLKPTGQEDREAQRRMALAFGEALTDTHRLFIERLNLSFTCGDFLFVHAGVRPGIPLQKQSERDLLWIREDFLLHEEDFGKIVVHGHTPAIEPEIRYNRINIDTGAYATGRLTCLVLEGNEMRFL
jgi:serine/threonine protein phosphatase 1